MGEKSIELKFLEVELIGRLLGDIESGRSGQNTGYPHNIHYGIYNDVVMDVEEALTAEFDSIFKEISARTGMSLVDIYSLLIDHTKNIDWKLRIIRDAENTFNSDSGKVVVETETKAD